MCKNDVHRPVFDVGANQGMITFALHDINPKLEYHTFEPQKFLHNIINANLVFQQHSTADGLRPIIDNIYTHNVAVSDKHEVLELPRLSNVKIGHFSGLSFGEDYADLKLRYVKVQSIRLDDLVFPVNEKTLALQCPQLIKVDVEGLEHSVIQGAQKLISSCEKRPILYFESHTGRNVTSSMRLIVEQLGYDRCYHHIFSYIRKHNYQQNVDDFKTFAPISDASSNLLCIGLRDDDKSWPTCSDGSAINNIKYIEEAILKRQLVLVSNSTVNGDQPICNFEDGEVGENTKNWCA